MSKNENRDKENEKDLPSTPQPAPVPVTEQFLMWLENLSGSELTSWERLPDIGLYMDQVLTLMDRQLAMYKREGEDKLLTQPMINNYTKDGLLPRALDKKYTQAHLALLSILCSLKPVLSMSDLDQLLKDTHDESTERDLYAFFLTAQEEAICQTKNLLEPEIRALQKRNAGDEAAPKNHEDERRQMALLALRMAVDARVRIMMTQKILDSLRK